MINEDYFQYGSKLAFKHTRDVFEPNSIGLLDFVMKYEPDDDSYNGNSIGYGIAPICVVLPSLVFYILNPIIFVASVVLIVLKERKIWKEFLFDLLFEFISFIIILIIYVIIGLFVHLANPFSAAPDQTFIYFLKLKNGVDLD